MAAITWRPKLEVAFTRGGLGAFIIGDGLGSGSVIGGSDRISGFWTAFDWTDVSSYFYEASVQRGRSGDLESMVAGSAAFALHDVDQDWNAENANGAFYPNVQQVMPIRYSFTKDWGFSTDPQQTEWTKQNVTIGTGISDPDGGTAAYSIRETTDTGYHRIYHAVSNVTTDDDDKPIVWFTFYFQPVGADKDIRVYYSDPVAGNKYITIDVSVPKVSANSGLDAYITDAGSNWYKVQVFNIGTIGSEDLTYVHIYLNAAQQYAGNTSDGINFYLPDFGLKVPLFTGFIEDIVCFPGPEGEYQAGITCIDALSLFDGQFPQWSAWDIPGYYADVDDMIGEVLTLGGWPDSSMRKLDSQALISGRRPAGDGETSLLAHLTTITTEVGGLFYIDAFGNATWLSNGAIDTAPRSTTQYSLTSYFQMIGLTRSRQHIVNEIAFKIGEVVYRQSDKDSQALYGVRRLGVVENQWVDGWTDGGAYDIMERNAHPRTRATVVLQGANDARIFQMCVRDLQDNILITEAPSDTGNYHIESIEHTHEVGNVLTTTWLLTRRTG